MIDICTKQFSETWLLERTYHAQRQNGQEISVPDLTKAMKEITHFYVPLSTWQEISQEEASAIYQQGTPVLLYGTHKWEHQPGIAESWKPNKNMRAIIFGNAEMPAEQITGTSFAVCYLDKQRGNASNASWKAWFPSDINKIFDDSVPDAFMFLRPDVQFPYTTHYTVIAPDGQSIEYADRSAAVQGFQTFIAQTIADGGEHQIRFPQFCYYHEITCPDGVYRIEFFGPHMDEPGYNIKERVLPL